MKVNQTSLRTRSLQSGLQYRKGLRNAGYFTCDSYMSKYKGVVNFDLMNTVKGWKLTDHKEIWVAIINA